MSVVVLASFAATAVPATGTAGVFGSAIVEQIVSGSPLEDFDAAVTMLPDGSETGTPAPGDPPAAAHSVSAAIRWTGAALQLGGVALKPTTLVGDVVLEEDMTPNRPSTMQFGVIGELWSMPTEDEDFETEPADPGEPAEEPGPGDPGGPPGEDATPRVWGNKDILLDFSFGASPRNMRTYRAFQGVTFQKSNRGGTSIVGEITCIDDSIKVANVALCYEIEPFGGMRRDEIVREMALSVGIELGKISLPLGELVTKPILLSNGSLIPFVNEFGRVENWWAHFDEYGNFVVEIIDPTKAADHVLDAERGDFDYDSFEEVPPSMPPSRYHSRAAAPVEGGGTTDGPTTTTDEIEALYNPESVKVRPSGVASYLNSDGSYRVNPEFALMVVARTVIERTIANGLETRKVIHRFEWYNPFKYDPNFDTSPPGAAYDGAYGDKTFHRDEAESFIETQTETVESSYDTNGTLQRTVQTFDGWYAPHSAGNWSPDRFTLINGYGSWIINGTSRARTEETFVVTKRVETDYIFNAEGFLETKDVKTFAWHSPRHWADIVAEVADPTAPPPTTIEDPILPPPTDPPPTSTSGGSGTSGGTGTPTPPPPAPPPYAPAITGPTSSVFSYGSIAAMTAAGYRFTFPASAAGIPDGVASSWSTIGAKTVRDPLTGQTSDSTMNVVGEELSGDGSLAREIHLFLPSAQGSAVSGWVQLTVDGYRSAKLYFSRAASTATPPPLGST